LAASPTLHLPQAPLGRGGTPLSVVLCTHARPDYLRACLAGLSAQSRRDSEVLVVDSASPPAEAAAIAALAAEAGARLLRTDQPGLSLARNLGLEASAGNWVAFIDDDAVPERDWAAALLGRIARLPERAAALGGRILPRWEAPLPAWWPPSLRGVLTIIEWEGFGEVGVDLPTGVEIYGANMAFAAAPLREVGGFSEKLGRVGNRLLSGEEVAVVESLRARGYRAFYDGAAAVRHSIQRERLRPGWLLSRLLWQGATDALRDRAGRNGHGRLFGAALRLLVQAPLLLWPATSSALLRARCGAAYNLGYLRGRFAGAA
jgi:glucosyl-dolichyl phosphate glucuronosyltransferase